MKKVVDLVLEGAFDGFCKNISSQDNNIVLFSDLHLNQDVFDLIIARVEMVLNINIFPKRLNKNSTLGDFRQLVENAYNHKYGS
ncbi:MAG: hypothetical protein JEY96_15485 [Bacteroidales bacterium]|nr:hypothetical protein [Bacteroidales bacterium]